MTITSCVTSLRPLDRWWFRGRAIAITICMIMVTAFTLAPVNAVAETTGVRVQRDLITVEAPAAYARYADNVMGHATAAIRSLNEETGDALLVPITFVVVGNEKQFKALSGGEGENTLAVALGGQRRVLINYDAMARAASDKIRQVLVHELTHVYLDVKCTGAVPRWVHEGVAQDVAGEWPEAPGEGSMAISAYTGGLIPLRELVHTFPADNARRNQAYAESYSAIKYLVSADYGGSLPAFLGAIRGDSGVKVLKTLGGSIDLDAFELRWRNELKSPLFAMSVILSSGFFWGLTALLVIAAWFVKRRHSRLLRQQWAREEAMAGEFESILDRVERFDESLAEARGEEAFLNDEEEAYGEQSPFDRYLAEKEAADPDDMDWRR